MPLKKYIRRNVYRWHRITSLFVVVPVLLWTISGFLHPVMGYFKPDIKNSNLPAIPIDSSKIAISLQTALLQNKIDRFQNFRIVKLYKGYYYQVRQKQIDSLTYINCESGNILSNGDKHYAGYLAQRYLWEENGDRKTDQYHHEKITANVFDSVPSPVRITSGKPKSKILTTTLLTAFSKNYKAGNKILPVYEVSFDRSDGIKLYIDTKADRLAFAADQRKRLFASFFALTHSWSFLNDFGKIKFLILGAFSALCFLSALLGFAVYNILQTKRKSLTVNKGLHRILGNIYLLTTLLFAFSGSWHALAKFPEQTKFDSPDRLSISTREVNLDLKGIYSNLTKEEKLTNVSIVRMNNEIYWQVFYQKGKEISKKYVHTGTNTLLKNGDVQYGKYLAYGFKSKQSKQIISTKVITAFNNSYSMMYKRLPVLENKFNTGEAVYVETSTGDVAAVTEPSGKAESFSFSNLHMHHYWERWLGIENGKTVRNTVLIISTFGLLVLAITGLLLFLRKKLF